MSIASPPPGPGGWPRAGGRPIRFDAFRAELLKLYDPPMRAKMTRAKLRQALDIVATLLGPGGTTAGLTPDLVARFIGSRPPGESPYTTKGLLQNLRTACAYAKARGYAMASPWDFRKKWIKVGRPRGKRHHPIEDIRRVLDLLAAEVREREGWSRWRARRLRAVAATVAYTGLRREEALGLHVEDVDLDRRMIFLMERDGGHFKTESSAQPVPIPEALVPIVEDWLAHRMDAPESGHRPPDCPYFLPNVTRTNAWTQGPQGHKPLDQLKAAGERAGVPGFTFLSLRHSYATHAESSWGLSPAMIQRVLRHTSLSTQWHYRHADTENLRAAVGGVDFGPPTAPGPHGGPTP